MPNESDLKQIRNNTATEIFSVDNKLLGRYYYQNRTNAGFDELPSHLIEALVATEDIRFYEHNGIDTRSTFRVLFKTILLFNKSSGGGSTISQQLAKNLFKRKDFGFLSIPVAKIREIIIAKRIEEIYSKEEILELYFNTVPFGENAYGIETASLIFFNKEPALLKIEESALLVGLLKANSSYNPRLYPEAAKNRRNTVISQMVRYKYLDKHDADSLKNIPIKLKYRRITHNEGPAPYFREHLRVKVSEILKDIKKASGFSYNLYADGLKIYTTINYKMQVYSENAVRGHMSLLQKDFDTHWKGNEPWIKNPGLANSQIKQSKPYKRLIKSGISHNEAIESMKSKHKSSIFSWDGEQDTIICSFDSVLHHFKILQTGVLAMNAFNGDVLAWIGGVNFKFFKYDHVKSKRQVGSTFKPIVYASAIEQGVKPCQVFANDSLVYENYDNWIPANSDNKYGGYYTMKGALAHSVNTVSAKVIIESGIENTVDLAYKMGIQSELPEVPSLALGSGEVSLYEMVRAYCSFLNRGRPVEPRIIRRIEDSKGRVIYSNPAHIPGDNIISKETAETLLAMMQGAVDRGTARGLRTVWGLDNELAGKTGTTQNQADGWFIGMNPYMVVGIWVGGDSPVVRFRNLTYGQGAYSALPIFARFLNQLYTDNKYKYMKYSTFNISENIYQRLDCEDFSNEGKGKFLDMLILKDSGIGDFIRKIFEKKKRKSNNEEKSEN